MSETNNSFELNSSTVLEYIKIQWQDIHHSRLQEYTVFGLAAAIFYALIKGGPEIQDIRLYISGLGFFFSIIGLLISWNHFQIFREKIQVIREMERKIGIDYPNRFVWLPVQTLIFWLFGGISGTFLGMTIFFASGNINFALASALAIILGCLLFIITMRLIQKKNNIISYSIPYCIENVDIENCLKSMGNIPLKLVVDKLLNRQNIKETPWTISKWNYKIENEKIIKPAFVTPKDVFQFSVADANSKQDWHFHKLVFEIYISSELIEIEYKSQAEKDIHSLSVKNGVLIVPPGLRHKVKLAGTTYVFQTTMAKEGGVNSDKTIVEINTDI